MEYKYYSERNIHNIIFHIVVRSTDVPQAVKDEHMGVVMSLFQRSDDNQKFLVTLNGYSNNLMKEKFGSEDDEERLEMEVIFLVICKMPSLNFNFRTHSRRTMFLLMLAGERGRRVRAVDAR